MKGYKHTEEAKRKISLSKLGKKRKPFTKEHKRRISLNSARWAGDKIGKRGVHHWVVSKLGKPTKCEHCGKDGLAGKQINWANKKHDYKRNLKDWLRLCCKCHKEFDTENRNKPIIRQKEI